MGDLGLQSRLLDSKIHHLNTAQWPLITISPVSKHLPGGSAGENPGALAENNHNFLGKPTRVACLSCVRSQCQYKKHCSTLSN